MRYFGMRKFLNDVTIQGTDGVMRLGAAKTMHFLPFLTAFAAVGGLRNPQNPIPMVEKQPILPARTHYLHFR